MYAVRTSPSVRRNANTRTAVPSQPRAIERRCSGPAPRGRCIAAAAFTSANGASSTHAALAAAREVNPPQLYPSSTRSGSARCSDAGGRGRQNPASSSPATRCTRGVSSIWSGGVPLTPWMRNSTRGIAHPSPPTAGTVTPRRCAKRGRSGTRVGLLDRAQYVVADRQGRTPVVVLAHEVEARLGGTVARRAVAPEAVHDVLHAARQDLGALRRHVE